MSEKFPTEKLEIALDFIRIANERGGYMDCGEEQSGVPALEGLVLFPLQYTHIPKPLKKVMMQMWRDSEGYYAAYPVSDGAEETTKIGEPFEYTFPEESE
jgi:hypothetical protein